MKAIDRLIVFQQSMKNEIGGQNKFEAYTGISNGYLSRMAKQHGDIGQDVLDKIVLAFPNLNLNWLFAGKGEMLLTQSENLSENKTNLAKQNKKEERLFGTKELKQILNKQREAMTEEFGKIIMDSMTNIINGQLEVLKMQIKTQAETIQGQKDSIDKVLDKVTGVEEKAGEIVKMVRKIG